MRLPLLTSNAGQIDLIDEPGNRSTVPLKLEALDAPSFDGAPLSLAIERLDEDPDNPRTEFPELELAELAADIALRGVLQPIVAVVKGGGRYRVLFGAKRLRAARRAGLQTVPVVLGSSARDTYAQVAENQKRHGLTPLDLARFVRTRVGAGDSNAEIAKQLGIDQTTIAHHLALLALPPVLEEALRSGRCTSPRTLYELAKLHETKPDRVVAILRAEAGITRRAVASLKREPRPLHPAAPKAAPPRKALSLEAQAGRLCMRIGHLLDAMACSGAGSDAGDIERIRAKLVELAKR